MYLDSTFLGLNITPSTQTFSDYVGSLDKNDYYRFTLNGRSSFNLSLSGMTANANVLLLNSSGQVLQSSVNTRRTAESIQATLDGGDYYIRVYPATRRASTNYTLGVSAVPTGYQSYTFKYTYGNGDYYTGSGYTSYGRYSQNQYINDTSANETGYYGSYQITGVTNYAGSPPQLNQVFVGSYYNTENSTSYTPSYGYGSSGLGSESGYLLSGNSDTYFGGKYYEADFNGYQSYTFKYSYGNGDYYTGSGYTSYGKYSQNQYINDTSANETGNYGSYQITGVTNYTGTTYDLNKVFVASYYNTENSTNYTPNSGYGSSGLGSEYGYLISANSDTYFGGKYYEADFNGYQSYTFKYSYGNGDYYTGSGYTSYGRYSQNQYINDTSANETGNYGSYQITGVTNYTGSTSQLNQVFVGSYYNTENSTNYTPNSGYGSNGLGSEYGYLISGNSDTYFGGKYYEADVTTSTRSFNIQFDYSFDTNGFFTSSRRAVLEAAASIWENIIQDEFANVPTGTNLHILNPQTNALVDFSSTYEIDDLAVFVGARNIDGAGGTLAEGGSSAWYYRGSSLDTRYNSSDNFEPWTGAISFDYSESWFFDATSNTSNDIPVESSDFLSVAVHELGHVLGISYNRKAFQNLVSGGYFIGANAKALNGGNPIPLSSDLSHVQDGFSIGNMGEAAMDPSITRGTRKLPNNLDIALLDDIGYQVNYI
ncbi:MULTISPECIES: matrixin family metalloprotease [Cyanophyceae]|uniref:matrixin family metalloprotease n=1 Tax=Cyanophyceae TaxID=3028117 RepID=UPI001687AD4F|nr:matrixin family metalloprotease [Trichocoleus sp. FACHB-40]MBD2004348.1 hypothetical protein [Trichocoleus sp. FACHB-40]